MTDDLRAHLQSSFGSTYTIERELPAGGMSRVFVAEERALGRRVVIKVLPPELAFAVSIERFKREIALAARLQHAHIVPLHAAGEIDGLPYFTMPFVAGDSLRVRLAGKGELPVNEAVRMLREIASALLYAHEQGLVHRDIKPDNILLSGGATMVTDFGVAKAVFAATSPESGALTSLGVALGTPAYMAPEQATADPTIDHRADLYAFGALAYEVLTGQPPFVGRSPQGLLSAQISELPEPVLKRRPGIPLALATLIMRCLEKRPADRPQSAAEIVAILDSISTSSGAAPTVAAAHVVAKPRTVTVSRGTWIGGLTIALVLAIGTLLWRASAEARPSLAVLPFENLGQPADEYFADGLTEEISSRLAGISGLGIIGRRSSQQYKHTTRSLRDIANDLHVNYVLTGSVLWERLPNGQSNVRVSPQLIRAADQMSAWAHSYEGPITDVFTFQSTVAERVAEAMNVALRAPERRQLITQPTRNLAAYDAYLRGLASSTRERLFEAKSRQTAIAEFQRAVELDPSFAAAHARLALSYVNAERYGRDAGALDNAAAHLQAATALDSSASETRLGRAWYLFEREDFEKAHAMVRTLLDPMPANSQALYLEGLIDEALLRFDEALASFKEAERLEPTSPDPPAALASLYDALGRHEEAVHSRDHEIALTPGNPEAYFAQAASYMLWSYDTVEARRVLERGVAKIGPAAFARLPRSWILNWALVLPPAIREVLDTLSRQATVATMPGPLFDEMKLRLYTLTGRPERARLYADTIVRLLELNRAPGDPERGLLLAAAYASLGRTADAQRESDAAFAMFSRASSPTRRIPAVIATAYVDMAMGRTDVALQRLESIFRLRTGFYISPVVLRVDAVWAPLRADRRFAQVVAAAR